MIRSFGGDSSVIVVLNKIKSVPFNVNRDGLKDKYRNIRHFIQTDCEDGTGIDDLRKLIGREAAQLPHLGDSYPEPWFAIKNAMEEESQRESYIPFERYRAICEQNGINTKQKQEQLAVWLNNLGIVLHFDDARLRNMHILNPNWVTKGIYAILTWKQLASQKGELSLMNVAEILDDQDRYPSNCHEFLLELMRKFELCFRLPDADDLYLVPQLLDQNQPPEAAEFNPIACLNFQYHYSVLPEGLLPRFIVKSRSLISKKLCWRTGVILEFEENRALVTADRGQKMIKVLVEGPTAGDRRRLLAIIRRDFQEIHKNFAFEIKQMVPVPEYTNEFVSYDEMLILEQNHINIYPKTIGNTAHLLDVKNLLNGVDLKQVRQRTGDVGQAQRRVRIFYSYSHKDEKLRDELAVHLKLFEFQGLIEQWHDRRIPAGADFADEIDENLRNADIILLLISSDFLASNYCFSIEMTLALQRNRNNEARVIPVILRPIPDGASNLPISELNFLPTNAQPVMDWGEYRDPAWKIVADGIEKVVKEVQRGNPHRTP